MVRHPLRDGRVLIDASNLVAGGAVQVAASFIDSLASLYRGSEHVDTYPWLSTVEIEASGPVMAELHVAPTVLPGLRCLTRRPADQLSNWGRRHDVRFTVFGPTYGPRRADRELLGFADVTSIYPTHPVPDATVTAPTVSTPRARFSRAATRRADHLVVEAEHVRRRLHYAWRIPLERISVVPNCVNEQVRRQAPAAHRAGWLYVSRGYPHKNIDLLGQVGDELARRGISDVTFVLTLRPDEWRPLSPSTRRHSVTIGPQTLAGLSGLYASSEGAVFPSLLECFSTTPLEALMTGTPLIASDRPFVRDPCGDAPLYADPLSPVAWADAIVKARTHREELIARGLDQARNFTSPMDRARSYCDHITSLLAPAPRGPI